VTSNRRLHRLAAFTAASVLFGITSTVSALATQHEAAPAAAPVAVVTNLTATEDAALRGSSAQHIADALVVRAATVPTKTTATRTAAPVKAKATRTTTKAKATTRTTTRKASTSKASATRATSTGVRVISHYTDAPGSQKAIDSCKLVLWTHAPLWLAGHNWCGWQWMAYVPTGSIVKVVGGAAAGTFVVTGHLRLGRQSGSLPTVHADLVLQTCVGSGTGLTLLRRV
jgi:hypothetical protein